MWIIHSHRRIPAVLRFLAVTGLLVLPVLIPRGPATMKGQEAALIPGEPDNIVTVAGIGPYIGDGELATLAGLNLVEGVAVDAAGNVLVADTGNNRIRKVNATTGIITTIAGSGIVGFSGDGGPATDARINAPSDLALDPFGNLYFTDSGNHVVRKFESATGLITTVAGTGVPGYSDLDDGGPAVLARINNPRGIALAVEASGVCVYFAELRSHVIRKVDGAGVVSTVAGTGEGANSTDGGLATETTINTPFGIALDALGNLYIGEAGLGAAFSHRVRRVDAMSKRITTVAGTGVPGFSVDGTLATAAQINSPRDIAFDGAGNLYFVDNLNNRIRRVNVAAGPDATIVTVAGKSGAGFGGDGGPATNAVFGNPFFIAIDGPGNLYIGDRGNSRVRKVDATTPHTVTTIAGGFAPAANDGGPATRANILNPAGVTLDAMGNLFVAENFANRIRRVDSATGTITTMAGTGVVGFSPDGIPAADATLNGPQGIAIDPFLNLYIAESGNFLVRKVDGSGTLTTVAGSGVQGFSGDGGPATQAKLNIFRNVALDGEGNLWIADSMNHRIRFVNLSAAPVTVAGRKVSPGTITTVVGTGTPGSSGDGGKASAAAINLPIGLAFDRSGNLFLSESNRVRFVNLSKGVVTIHGQEVKASHITTVAGGATPGDSGDRGPAMTAQLFGPQGLAFDAAGNLFIADANNHRIRRVDPTGVITTVTGNGNAGFSGDGGPAATSAIANPRYVASDAAGNLHLTEFGGNRLRRLNLATKELTVDSSGGNVIAQVTVHGGRSVADLSNVTLTAIDALGQAIDEAVAGEPASLGNPPTRIFIFDSNPSLLTTERLRFDGVFATDGRRVSGDCVRQNGVRCVGLQTPQP